jgi:phosphoadenosine phosphosulfate reductase
MSGEALRAEDAIRGRMRSFASRVDATLFEVGEAILQAERPYVALSGGKDSVVALDIMRQFLPDIECVWCDDEIEYDGTCGFVQSIASGHLSIVSGYATHGGWFRPWRDSPYWRQPDEDMIQTHQLVEDWAPANGYDAAVTGVRADESMMRRQHAAPRGEYYHRKNGTLVIQPLIGWQMHDIWAYIASRELSYHPVYDTMALAGIPRANQRVGPLPLAPRWVLQAVDPTLPSRLEKRYGGHW